MKVKELISVLQKFNPESEICEENNEYDFPRYFYFNALPRVVDATAADAQDYFAYYLDNYSDNTQKIVVIREDKNEKWKYL